MNIPPSVINAAAEAIKCLPYRDHGEPPSAEEMAQAALEAVAPDIREAVLRELHERIDPLDYHENSDGIWVAQSAIEEMVEEQRR